jgi:hypothetical protein
MDRRRPERAEQLVGKGEGWAGRGAGFVTFKKKQVHCSEFFSVSPSELLVPNVIFRVLPGSGLTRSGRCGVGGMASFACAIFI